VLVIRPRYWISVLLLTLVTVLSISARPAFADDEGGRKVKNKVQPVYPDLAKRMNVTGSVKVEVVISPNGTIKSTKVIGGHPLLIEPAVDAIKKWRFEPGSEETTTTVEFRFNNN
jgi:TonB family protein